MKLKSELAEALCNVHGEIEAELRDEANAGDPYRVVVLVESTMFEKRGRLNGAQKHKYRSIIFNIGHEKTTFQKKSIADEP